MRVEVDASDITTFVNRMANWPVQFGTVQVSALNDVGGGVVRQLTQLIADDTGLSYSAAGKYITFTRATMANREFQVRVKSDILEEDAKSDRIPAREWPQRESSFTDDQLFNVVTAQDDAVCNICERISKEGPYSVAQIRGLKGRHGHFLSRDLNCRCETTPFKPVRRLPVRMRVRGSQMADMQQTARQLAQRILKDSMGAIRMK